MFISRYVHVHVLMSRLWYFTTLSMIAEIHSKSVLCVNKTLKTLLLKVVESYRIRDDVVSLAFIQQRMHVRWQIHASVRAI